MNVIKERNVDETTLSLIKSSPDFIAILSDLITYNKKYENIIKNQFGNIIISKDIDSANRLSRIIKNRYKIITLEGDVINIGGSMTGGSLNKTRSSIIIIYLNNFSRTRWSPARKIIKIASRFRKKANQAQKLRLWWSTRSP